MAQKLVLSGYGVGLDIKKADYLAINDDDQHSNQDPSPKAIVNKDLAEDLIPLTRIQLAGLSVSIMLRAMTQALFRSRYWQQSSPAYHAV